MGARRRAYVGRVTKPCEKCGADVSRKHSAIKDHVFCSRDCFLNSDYMLERKAASNARRYAGKRVVRLCRQCGAEVERAVSQFTAADACCSMECRRAFTLDRAQKKINSRGYVVVFVGVGYPGAGAASQGQMLEHRKVMQDFLDRPLTADENVHHRNGDRKDNRLENLELWTRSQPPGQRVADKLAWARDLIALYAGTGM
jgi:hypothetical protein